MRNKIFLQAYSEILFLMEKQIIKSQELNSSQRNKLALILKLSIICDYLLMVNDKTVAINILQRKEVIKEKFIIYSSLLAIRTSYMSNPDPIHILKRQNNNQFIKEELLWLLPQVQFVCGFFIFFLVSFL